MAKTEETLFDETKLPQGTVAVEADISEAVADEAPEQAAEEPAAETQADETADTTETPNEGEQATATETTEEEKPAEEAEATETEAAAEGDEKPAEEKPAEAAPAAAAPVVDDETKQAAEWARSASAMMNEDPEFRVAWLKTLKKRGQLPQQGEVELAGLESLLKAQGDVASVQKDAPPQKSEADIAAEMRKLFAQGKELEAMKLYRQHDPVAQEVAALKAKQDLAEKERAQAEHRRQQAEVMARAGQQLKELATAHPDLLSIGGDGRPQFKDKAFGDELRAAARGLSPDIPLADIAKYALFKLGRLQSAPTSKTVNKTVTKPPITQAPRPGGSKPKAPPLGEVTVDFTVE